MEIVSMINGAIGEIVWTAERYYSIDRHANVAINITLSCVSRRPWSRRSDNGTPARV